MKIIELKKNFQNALSGLYPWEEIHSFFNMLSEKYLGLTRIQIALNPEVEVAEEDSEKFEKALLRLKKHEPIQYIIGETEFYGLPFKVNKHTLIPRPETEELVEWVLGNISPSEAKRLLDIGTGSGCIAISLAKNLQKAEVSALDISEEALTVARENTKLNSAEVTFFQTDILKAETLPKQYDIMVSNPPYVRELEKKTDATKRFKP
jgi:release factor glutamine methyltransferase